MLFDYSCWIGQHIFDVKNGILSLLPNKLYPLRLKYVCFFLVLLIPKSAIYAQETIVGKTDSVSRVVDFLSKYVAIPSVTGSERTAGAFFEMECRKHGLNVQVLTDDSSSYNFVASLYPLDLLKPNIILLTHIDVVEPGDSSKWKHGPFSGKIADGAIWGRGSIDNKGMGAMQFEALLHFVDKAKEFDLPFNVSLVAVSGEETGGATGAAIISDQFLSLLNPIVVLGEGGTGVTGVFSSDPNKVLFGIAINDKRILWLRLRLKQESGGHGSVPTKLNATMSMIEALNRLNRRKNSILLSSAARIMFTEIGNYEVGIKGFALRNIGWMKPFVEGALRKEPIMQSIVSNTVTLTNISNPEGSKNQVPQEVEAILDCRLLPETDTDDFIRKLKKALNNEHISVEIIKETVKGEDSRPDVFYAMMERSIKKVYPGAEVAPILFPATSDNNYFRAKGIASFGLLSIQMSHETISGIHNFNEQLPIHSLEQGVAFYKDFIDQVFSSSFSKSNLSQTVRGRVLDKYTGLPLAGCMIILANDSAIVNAGRTNIFGDFRMANIPVGRYRIKAISEGYIDIDLLNILVSTGRETMMNLHLEETAAMTASAAVREERGPLNEMATVSARRFDVDETGRYAGSRNDPARMVANFAGVRGTDDSRNDIIIRGNAPFGLSWRLEDIDIPNPNHYAIFGTSGGGVNILNNKLLDRSDFYSGVLPAEFGNATAGVFDLKMRRGNDEKYEVTAEAGSIVTELNIEGPINKSSKSSFLLSYRHSTLGMIDKVINAGDLNYSQRFGIDAVPHFQDGGFKLHFPLKNATTLTVFGTGGISNIQFFESRRNNCSFSYEDHGQDVNFGSKMAVGGINYLKNIGNSSYLKISGYTTYASMSSNRERIFRDSISGEVIGSRQEYRNESAIHTLGLASQMGRKFSSRQSVKGGLTYDLHRLNMVDTIVGDVNSGTKSVTGTIKSFIQWRYRFSNDLSLSFGANGLWFTLNNSWAIDPRAGMVWNITRQKTITAAVGIHSQLQPMYLYFQEQNNSDGSRSYINKEMGVTRSQQYIIGFEDILTENLRWKVEVYFQNLTNIPVQAASSSWSMVNEGLDFKLSFPGKLKNAGTGQNYGVELTIERTFNKRYYYLLTASLFDSKYTGSDNVRRNTDYNGSFIVNYLVGKEFVVGKRRVLNLAVRATYAGGRRHSPIDLEASKLADKTIYVDSLAYTQQFRDYFRADLKLTYRINNPKFSHEIGVDLVNVIPIEFRGETEFPVGCGFSPLSTRNILTALYDPVSQRIRTEYQLGFLPIAYYRILF